jgi:hypothetical protein
MEASPEWEEPYYLLGDALSRGNFLTTLGNFNLNYKDIFPLLDTLPSTSWKVSASVNSQEAYKALDNNPNTRWTTQKPQEPGMWFEMDMKKPQTIRSLSVFLGNSIYDYPRKLEIKTSLEGHNWQEVRTEAKSVYYITQDRLAKRTIYTFPPTTIRFIRLYQRGKTPEMYWSIHELEIPKD